MDTVELADDISVLGLEPRVLTVLKWVGIQRVGDLTGLTITEIESIGEGDVKIVGSILRALARYDLSPRGYYGIELLSLSTRTYNALKRAGIKTLAQLLSKDAAEISSIPNIGRKASREIAERTRVIVSYRKNLAASLAAIIDEFLDCLQARERTVIEMRYGLDGLGPRTLKQIGEMFGVSRERVRQIEKRALHRLRRLDSFKPEPVQVLLDMMEDILWSSEGFMTEDQLTRQIARLLKIGGIDEQGAILLLVDCSDRFEWVRGRGVRVLVPSWENKVISIATE